MGYQIVYQRSGGMTTTTKQGRKNHKNILVFAIIAILLITVFSLASKYKEPEDPNVTERAFTAFSENLQEGKGIKDSFTVFCKEIIDGADIS